jgi:hypothetical protein
VGTHGRGEQLGVFKLLMNRLGKGRFDFVFWSAFEPGTKDFSGSYLVKKRLCMTLSRCASVLHGT